MENQDRTTSVCRQLLDCLPDAAAALDRNGVLFFVNPRACELTGYSTDELLGSRLAERLDPDDRDAVAAQVSRTIRTGIPVSGFKTHIRRKNGERRTVGLDLHPLIESGRITGAIGTAEDLTARERAEHQYHLLESMVLELSGQEPDELLEWRTRQARRHAGARDRDTRSPLVQLFPGNELATLRLRQQILDAAASRRLPVMVLGERGTGKALVAREIHRLSPRHGGPFVAVDCAAIPASLFESEMFGHEKGAFTGAAGVKRGLFQQAHGGTLFLDEIGELSLEQQAKLLVAIQDRSIRRVGGTIGIAVDVRIVSATNRDLDRMRADGTFRHDLYDRLRGFAIAVPPLRERGADLELYVDRLVDRWSAEEGTSIAGVDAAVADAFRRYPWPGNVRELEFVIGRMVAGVRGAWLTADLLPPELTATRPGDSNPPREHSKAEIEGALERHHGVVRRAARDLGISRSTLYRLMTKHGIRPR